MNEKAKAEAVARARKIQPGESSKIKELQETIRENEHEEGLLFASRGYGGYIKTEHLEAIRETTWECVEEIEHLRSGSNRVQAE